MSIVSGEFLHESPFGQTNVKFLIPEQPRFVALTHFRVDLSDNAEVRISEIMSDFDLIVNVMDLPLPKMSVNGILLGRHSTSGEVMTQMGGQNARLFLSQIWWLLKRQPLGQAGYLPTDSKLALFFVSFGTSTYEVTVQWENVRRGWMLGATRLEAGCLRSSWFWAFGHAA